MAGLPGGCGEASSRALPEVTISLIPAGLGHIFLGGRLSTSQLPLSTIGSNWRVVWGGGVLGEFGVGGRARTLSCPLRQLGRVPRGGGDGWRPATPLDQVVCGDVSSAGLFRRGVRRIATAASSSAARSFCIKQASSLSSGPAMSFVFLCFGRRVVRCSYPVGCFIKEAGARRVPLGGEMHSVSGGLFGPSEPILRTDSKPLEGVRSQISDWNVLD